MEIFNRLNEIPHLQEIIVGHYKSALNKDHEEHDEKKLYRHHYEGNILLEGKIPDDAYEYNLPIISFEVNNDIMNISKALPGFLKKKKNWSKNKIRRNYIKQRIKHALNLGKQWEVKRYANKKRIRIWSKRYDSAIKIQSVVRGWLSRR